MSNSTVMFSGFDPSTRNSSKVLRPPGGGSSDIFGLKNGEEPKSVEEETEANTIETSEQTPGVAVVSTTEEVHDTEKEVEPKEVEKVKDPKAVEEKSDLPEEKPKEEENSATTPPPDQPLSGVKGTRGRVPPGGHSSGSFW